MRDAQDEILREEPAWVQPWKPSAGLSAWDLTADNGRSFHFNAPSGDGAITFDSNVQRAKFPLTDWLAYDQVASRPEYSVDRYDTGDPQAPDNAVSDLKLAFTYHRESGDGALTASLSKLDRTFSVRIAPNRITLQSRQNQNTTELAAADIALEKGDHRIEFMNVDYCVTVRIDGRDIIRSTPEQYAPDIPLLLRAFDHHESFPKPTISIEAADQVCTLSHVGLWRDIYYGNRPSPGSDMRAFHASPQNFPDNVTHLASDEFFVMGDNSPISMDARYWTDPIRLPDESLNVEAGRVPERFLLGKAFFVYWPAGYRPFESAPALVPNFGDMRLIH
ncbi:MAG: hypothetical protein JO353_04945 [Phycisphaerae bacterium]|nr:hypothetical protein [Phycisphaerae bacterium]